MSTCIHVVCVVSMYIYMSTCIHVGCVLLICTATCPHLFMWGCCYYVQLHIHMYSCGVCVVNLYSYMPTCIYLVCMWLVCTVTCPHLFMWLQQSTFNLVYQLDIINSLNFNCILTWIVVLSKSSWLNFRCLLWYLIASSEFLSILFVCLIDLELDSQFPFD